MTGKDFLGDCTENCMSLQHGDAFGAALTWREPTDRELASALTLLCGNVGSIADSLGRTILHMAASLGRRELVQWLIQRCDANLNAQDHESGYTPLHRSIFYGQINVAVILLQLGADVSIKDNNGLSPIELAMKDRAPDYKFTLDLPCEIYVWGTNTNFNLGLDNMQGRQQPEVLDFFRKLNRQVSIVQVLMEKFHTIMISSCGRVWTCGHGQGGRLGLGSERTVLAPMPVHLGSITKSPSQNSKSIPGQPEICVSAALGRDHTVLLMESYTILVFGLNTHHVLGLSPPPDHVLEPHRLPMRYLEDLKDTPLGVCAGRFHSVIWSRKEILTFGLNAGQLGHPKSLEKTVIFPKPVNALFYKDVEITHVAASDGATVVATGSRHIWVLHEYQKTRLSMRYPIAIEKVVVVGGHLDSEIDPSSLSEKGEPLKIAAISKEGSVFLWQEKDLLMTRCILSSSRQLRIIDIELNLSKSALLLVTEDGEAYCGEIKPCKVKNSEVKSSKGRKSTANSDGECHVVYKQTEKSKTSIKEFLDPDVCYPVSLSRLSNAHRSLRIKSDPKGRNFALIQAHPSAFLNNVPELPPEKQGLRHDLLALLNEANEWDSIHDIIFEVEHRRFAAHQFIVSKHSSALLHMIHESKKSTDKGAIPFVKISDVSADMFEQILQFMYYGQCALTHPKDTCPHYPDIQFGDEISGATKKKQLQQKLKNGGKNKSSNLIEEEDDLSSPLMQARTIGKKLGLTKFVALLKNVTYYDGRIHWVSDSKKMKASKPEIVEMDWNEASEFCDASILSKDGVTFNVHKCILAARSEYFHNMLAGGWIESRGTSSLQIPLDQSVLSILLDYIYKDVTPCLDKINAADFDLAMHALIAADGLLINPFKTRCEAALASMLTLRNVAVVMELAFTYNAPDLRDCCYQFVCLNLPSLLESGNLYGISPLLLDGLRDYYFTFHPKMQCRVITPYSYAPTIDFIKEISSLNLIMWEDDLNFESPDKMETQKKTKISTRKKARLRRSSETCRVRQHADSVSSTNSDDMDTSFDPEPIDWSDLMEKEESGINQSMGKISLESTQEMKEKTEKHNQWIKVLNSSKAHKTVQARLKAAAMSREEEFEVTTTPKANFNTFLPHSHAPTLPTQSPVQSPSLNNMSLRASSSPRQNIANTLESHFPQLGQTDLTRGGSRVNLVAMPSNEKRPGKLSQKQRKKLATEEPQSASVSVVSRGWEKQEELLPGTPQILSLADIMQEQLKKSKTFSSATTKPISIKRSPASSSGFSQHALNSSGSPWGRLDVPMSPSTPPSMSDLSYSDASPNKDELRLNFSDIIADEMKQRENWTRMRAKPLNLTQIEDRAIEDLISFYNANEACEERITVRRVLSTKVARPVWVTSKH
ncbi:Inhibitor of Bruton tyrosine kinase [Frankliniella fusca]|uniref:Inhibitor of Bruton tyrosine kinase n=1 Tax=Frankliniella fusca TaxID=407009 RepID=A0AAE1LIB1_9NEOP|nr:Inhibitor of Bruton tyrosine kinase [Frankliniella fusca]